MAQSVSPFAIADDVDPIDVDQIDDLLAQAIEARKKSEQYKAQFDSIKEQIQAFMRDAGIDKLEGANGKASLRETKSDWQYSDATTQLATQLKTQQDIEKRKNIAVAGKVSVSLTVSGR